MRNKLPSEIWSLDLLNQGFLSSSPAEFRRYPVGRIDLSGEQYGEEVLLANVTGQQFKMYDFVKDRALMAEF